MSQLRCIFRLIKGFILFQVYLVKVDVLREGNAIFFMYFTTQVMNSGKLIEVSRHLHDMSVGDQIVTLIEIGTEDLDLEVERGKGADQDHTQAQGHHIPNIDILGQGHETGIKDQNIGNRNTQGQNHVQNLGVIPGLGVLLGQGQKKGSLERITVQETILNLGQGLVQGQEVEKSIAMIIERNNTKNQIK